jgi:hypothetical protein
MLDRVATAPRSETTLWSNLGTVLDGGDGGAVAAKYKTWEGNLKE